MYSCPVRTWHRAGHGRLRARGLSKTIRTATVSWPVRRCRFDMRGRLRSMRKCSTLPRSARKGRGVSSGPVRAMEAKPASIDIAVDDASLSGALLTPTGAVRVRLGGGTPGACRRGRGSICAAMRTTSTCATASPGRGCHMSTPRRFKAARSKAARSCVPGCARSVPPAPSGARSGAAPGPARRFCCRRRPASAGRRRASRRGAGRAGRARACS